MSRTIKVTYNSDTLETTITVDGKPFDTSRINGKEIADWAYDFKIRKVRWNGFYDEMVEALGGEKEFNLVFEGSEADLNELKEAWEDAPVTVISADSENVAVIEYDENNLTTKITIGGQPFDTTRINGREIADWVYDFKIRKVRWNGIFAELAEAIGSEEYTIQFFGSDSAMSELMEECPESVTVIKNNDITEKSEKVEKSVPVPTMPDKKISTETAKAVDNNSEELKKLLDSTILSAIAGDNVNESELEKSMDTYLKCAENGDVYAKCLVGFIYMDKYDDKETAMKWINEAIEDDCDEAKILKLFINDEESEESIELLKTLCDEGNYLAIYILGICYIYGIGGAEEDDETGVELIRKVAENGIAEAQYSLGDYYLEYSDNSSEAVKWLKKSAEKNYAKAQYRLGQCYLQSWGVDENLDECFKWTWKSAQNGYAEAQCDLGHFYLSGIGISASESEAFKWFKKAAEQGHPHAETMLGWCYIEGHGTKKNITEGFNWTKKAAEQEYPKAQYNLGILYCDGIGVEQNPNKAVELIKASANNGYADAQIWLGDMFCDSEGDECCEEALNWYMKAVEQDNVEAINGVGKCYVRKHDYNKAREWFMKAAEMGRPASLCNVGLTYEWERNDKEAVKWYMQAIEQGHAEAYYYLGEQYRCGGNGVKKDKKKAKECFQKGIDSGVEECRESLKKVLSDEKRSEVLGIIGEGISKVGEVTGKVGLGILQAYIELERQEKKKNKIDF